MPHTGLAGAVGLPQGERPGALRAVRKAGSGRRRSAA
jgi:hypothetical protein